jgi:NADPH-dependent glutamate synthase beta subunit-like oxidoreductase/NAD(P)H-flavin reductase
MSDLALGFGLKFEDLYEREGLLKVDYHFLQHLKESNSELYHRLISVRNEKRPLAKLDYSNLIVELAPIVEDYIAKVFNIELEVNDLSKQHNKLSIIFRCKRLFVQRRAVKEYASIDWLNHDISQIETDLLKFLGMQEIDELSFSEQVMLWLQEAEKHKQQIDLALQYAAWATLNEKGKIRHKAGVLFKLPKKLDPLNLIDLKQQVVDEVKILKSADVRSRDGFSLTDTAGTLIQALDHANYCIFCHNQGKDSCSKGFLNSQPNSTKFKTNVFGEQLTGCPLEEKISEMNNLKSLGYTIGALATVIIDNPMVAATGHRICNDCMKSCIYQKQEPVNIPKVETRVLNDVLNLPWGFEIYSLLTRWNPLNIENSICKIATEYKILVAGLGPAGFTLAHYLLNEGHVVVGIDGLKIEPLDPTLSGINEEGRRVKFLPIKDINRVFENLDNRVAQGFGGVAEYGITVRWNKNYLKIIRLLLERRSNFRMFGNVRFGSNITYETATRVGFDHIALAFGAGKPNLLEMPNAFAGGVKMASDFLMALQLTGAARYDLIANLQVRLPILVIGGGLTAIDTATESAAYYVRQVEKFAERYNILVEQYGLDEVTKDFTPRDWLIAQEFIEHAKIFAEERGKATQENRSPNFINILDQLGGVNVVYRKSITDAPSYRLNPEELHMAMEEGIGFVENAVPQEVQVDQDNNVTGLKVNIEHNIHIIPARTVFIAAGTNPNTVLQREDPVHFQLDKKYFRAIDEEGNIVSLQKISKPDNNFILTTIDQENRAVSFFGDLHPSYAGNVVKAMASAKNGYQAITNILQKRKPEKINTSKFFETLNNKFTATIKEVIQLTPSIVEVIIKSPFAAEQFQPGQFYRLQNYEANALKATIKEQDIKLAMEGIAVTGAWVDKTQGLISLIVLEMGGSSDLCRFLKPDEKVALMGPTGRPTEIKANEQVMLVGGGLGNAVLFSIAKAFKEAGSKVLYFAGYKKMIDRYKVAEIEQYADEVVWCCDEGLLSSNRTQDKSYYGNIVNAILAYSKGELGQTSFDLKKINRIIAIGSDRMMAAVNQARHSILQNYLSKDHIAVASINSPMQCMMKEICAQCLQKHVDHETGIETYVYSCFDQDQQMSTVDFGHLHDRLKQNSLQEKLTTKWVNYSLQTLGKRAIINSTTE